MRTIRSTSSVCSLLRAWKDVILQWGEEEIIVVKVSRHQWRICSRFHESPKSIKDGVNSIFSDKICHNLPLSVFPCCVAFPTIPLTEEGKWFPEFDDFFFFNVSDLYFTCPLSRFSNPFCNSVFFLMLFSVFLLVSANASARSSWVQHLTFPKWLRMLDGLWHLDIRGDL